MKNRMLKVLNFIFDPPALIRLVILSALMWGLLLTALVHTVAIVKAYSVSSDPIEQAYKIREVEKDVKTLTSVLMI